MITYCDFFSTSGSHATSHGLVYSSQLRFMASIETFKCGIRKSALVIISTFTILFICPSTLYSSPSITDNRDDLPLPTCPTIAVKLPRLI